MKELGDIAIKYGMLFIMKDTIPPLYENYANIKGGCYSLRINRLKASHYFMIYTISAMMGNVVNNSSINQIQGVSISPKRIIEKNQYFNVIKIWNKDCTKFNSIENLIRLDNIHQHSDIIYTPHIEKKL
jgi:hypothetical protein